MNFRFRTNKLQRRFEEEAVAKRTYGERSGRLYIRRILTIGAAESIADLFPPTPGRFHPLEGDREGQFAFDLEHPKRLVLELEDNGRTVVIVDVVDYHR